MAGLNFNIAEYEPDAGGFGEPIPAGWQDMMIDESSVEPTKDNATTGNLFVKLRFSIMQGPYKGRKIFKQFNIKNTSQQAETIGRKQLSAVAHAVGVPNCQDTMQLHGIPLKGKVTLELGTLKPDGSGAKYPDRNDINTFKNINEVVENTPAAAAPAPVANPFATKPTTPAAAAPATPAFVAPTPAPAPVAPPPVAAAPLVAAPFPPEGWLVHPQNPAYYYKGQEVVEEAALRARFAAPAAAPAAPVAPDPVVAPSVAAAAQAATPPWAR